MSGISSSRTRTKKSDLAQLFRGYPSRQSSQKEPVESPYLSVPEDCETTTPKKSKLPFLYRTRKKSTPSVKSGILPSTGRGYESEAAELPTTKLPTTTTTKDRRLSHPMPSLEPTIKKGALPAVKAIPQINASSPSLGSKFVAHFSNSKLRKVSSSQSTKVAPSDGNTRDKLFPPPDNRTRSIDSITTAATISPSTPGSAVITIASAPDNLEAYSNIFTLSKAKRTTIPKRLPSTPASEYRDHYNKTEPNVLLSPSSPSIPRLPFCPRSPVNGLPSSSQDNTREQDSRRLTDGSKSPKLSKRAPGPKLAEDSTPEDSADESVLHLRPGDLTPTIDVTPPPPPIKAASPTPRHRLRTSSAIKDPRFTDPPSIPLPDPPVMKNSPPASPTSPRSSPRLAMVSPSPSIITRPRANTTGSVPLSPVTAAAMAARASSPKQSSPKLSGENYTVKKTLNKESSDLDGMTVGQLKEALAQRNQQYAELTTHLLEVTKSHAVEKAALERKITALTTEVARKDKEIQGFTWMLNNRGTRSPHNDDVDYARIPGPRIQRSPSAASSKMSSRRIQQGDDSGAESPSGAESVPGSGGSVCLKRGLRPLTLGDSSYYRSSISSKASSRGQAFDLSDQRTSVYSLSSSAATSSTSSLLPPSPSLTHSSLSAIPEVSVVTSSRVALPRISTSRTCDSASEWETDPEKKSYDVVRPSKRVSTSSSSSAATGAYAANLKRGRPPSIAQVLHKSGTMEDVLEKLHSPICGRADGN